MNAKASRRSLYKKRGSSLVEFLMIGPLVCLLMYGAIDLNERLDQKGSLRIASRNALASGHANDPTDETLQKTLRDDVIRSGQLAFEDAQTQVDLVQSSRSGAASHGSRLVATLADIHYDDSAASTVLSDNRLTDTPATDDPVYRKLSASEGQFARGGRLLDSLVNMKVLNSELFIPDAMRVATVRLSTPEQSSLFKRGIGLFDRALQRQNPDAQSYGHLATDLATRYYARVEPGYHPNGYQSQGLMGYAISLNNARASHWGDAYERREGLSPVELLAGAKVKEGFPKECLMNFTAGDRCTDTNWYAAIILVVAEVRGIISIIHGGQSGGSEAGGSGYNAHSKFAQEGNDTGPANQDAGKAAGSFQINIGQFVQRQISASVSGMAGSLPTDPSALIKDQVMGPIENQAGGTMNSQFGGLFNTMGQEADTP